MSNPAKMAVKSSTQSDNDHSSSSSTSNSSAPSPLETGNEDTCDVSAKLSPDSSIINIKESSSSSLELVPIPSRFEHSETETSEKTMISMEKYEALKQQHSEVLKEKDERIAKLEQEVEDLKKKYQNEKANKNALKTAMKSVGGMFEDILKEDKESSDEENGDDEGNVAAKQEHFEKWTELPNELKIHCIETLDLKTRWSLRSTSHTERALVDSQRYNFEALSLAVYWWKDGEEVVFDGPDEIEIRFSEDPTEKLLPLLEWVLRTCNIGYLSYHTEIENFLKEFEKMEFRKPIQIKEVWMPTFNNHAIAFLMKLWNGVELMEFELFDAPDNETSFAELAQISSVVEAKELRVGGHNTLYINANATHFVPLIEKWMENGEVGKKFIMMDVVGCTVEPFILHFQEKLISRKGIGNDDKCEILFKCNSPRKNIRLVIDSYGIENDIDYFILCLEVIPLHL